MQKQAKTTIVAVAAIFIITLSAIYSDAVGPGGPGRHRGFRGAGGGGMEAFILKLFMSPEFLKDAGIPSAKAEQVAAIARKVSKDIIPLEAKIKIEKINLMEALEAQEVDREKVLEIAKKIHDFAWQMRKIGLEAHIKVLNILTKEEKQKIKDFFKKKFFERRHGPGHQRPMPPR